MYSSTDSIVDLPNIQQRRDARDPNLTLFPTSASIQGFNPDPPITQAHLDAAVDALLIMSQPMKRHLPDLDALLLNFGWVGKERICDKLV